MAVAMDVNEGSHLIMYTIVEFPEDINTTINKHNVVPKQRTVGSCLIFISALFTESRVEPLSALNRKHSVGKVGNILPLHYSLFHGSSRSQGCLLSLQ